MRASPDDIVGMAFFGRVVEARSFSDAARSLGVSKSAVSARVARLEERLGVQLLHRTTRRIALTADGVRLYERCARMIAEADQAAEIAAGASAVPRGTLRIHAPPGLTHSWLAATIFEFVRSHPSVRIDLRLSDRFPDLGADGLDIGIVVAGRLADSGLTTRKLASVFMAVCAAPSYLRRKGIPFRPQDLVLHDCLSHSVRQATDDLRFSTDEGAVSMTSLSSFLVDDARFLRDAAIAGFGIAMLPGFLIADDVAAGRLHRVLDDFPIGELAVHALHPHGRFAPASVRAFLDHLADRFRQAPGDTAVAAIAPRPVKSKARGCPMTEQDVRRLTAVAALYSDVQPEDSASLRATVERAKVTIASKVPPICVTMNSRIRVRDAERREREVSLVYPWDASRERISVLSPLGRELLGATIGSRVIDGARALTVTAIPYQPEAAGDHNL